MQTNNTALKTIWFSILASIFLVAIKAAAGYWGNSYALWADAIESTADVFSSALVFLGLWYAKKPADKNHPYGHGKIEPLITFLVVAFLVISAIVIALESLQNINTPHAAPKAWTLLVLAAIIVWKEISFQYVIKKSKETNSMSLKADAWHHRSDAITSIAAFIGISLALLLGKGFEAADDWAALFASGFIVYNSYLIFRPALGEVMDEHLYDEITAQIRKLSLEVEGVKNTEKCFIRKSGIYYHIDLHIEVDGTISVKQGHDIAHHLQDYLKLNIPQIHSVLIHIEPFE